VTHGETYLNPDGPFDEDTDQAIFWSQGGPLRGSSPKQIAFLRSLIEDAHEVRPGQRIARSGFTPAEKPYYLNASACGSDGKTVVSILYYFDFHQPVWYEFTLPAGEFTAEWIDPLAMKITPLPGKHTGKAKLRLPAKPWQALRFRAVSQ
jgi:hypothetical protein